MGLLSNQHILLRALEPEDLDFLKAIENDPDNWKHGDTIQPFSEYILKEYIKVAEQSIMEAGQLRLLIADKQDEKRIGFIDLYDFDQRHKRAGVAIIIHQDHQRNGFALQALQIIEKYAFENCIYISCMHLSWRIICRVSNYLKKPAIPIPVIKKPGAKSITNSKTNFFIRK